MILNNVTDLIYPAICGDPGIIEIGSAAQLEFRQNILIWTYKLSKSDNEEKQYQTEEVNDNV
jgi:hypothetical protein